MIRRAATLVELLVVISIITILLSLLLVGVNAARERSRHLSCQNNVRQLALAGQHFVTTYGYVPSNGWGFRWIGQLDRGTGRKQPGGWIFQIAPMLEIKLSHSNGDLVESRGEWTELSFPVLRCPSRGPAGSLPHTNLFVPFNAAPRKKVGKTDYAICEGTIVTDTREGPPSIDASRNWEWQDTSHANGVSFQRSEVRIGEIQDGLSNTYLLGEKHVSRKSYYDETDLGYDQSWLSGVDIDIARWARSPPISDSQNGKSRQFGGPHSSGATISLCDSSVRSISFQIDSSVHRNLGNRMDGESVTVPQ